MPAVPATVILVDSSAVNEYRLIVLDLQWRIREASVKKILGIITEDEYNAEIVKYKALQDAYDKAFKYYQERLNLLD